MICAYVSAAVSVLFLNQLSARRRMVRLRRLSRQNRRTESDRPVATLQERTESLSRVEQATQRALMWLSRIIQAGRIKVAPLSAGTAQSMTERRGRVFRFSISIKRPMFRQPRSLLSPTCSLMNSWGDAHRKRCRVSAAWIDLR